MGKAIINVSDFLLKKSLHMPDETEILGCKVSGDSYGTIELMVSHPDIKQNNENKINTLSPTVKNIPEKFIWDWNQKEG